MKVCVFTYDFRHLVPLQLQRLQVWSSSFLVLDESFLGSELNLGSAVGRSSAGCEKLEGPADSIGCGEFEGPLDSIGRDKVEGLSDSNGGDEVQDLPDTTRTSTSNGGSTPTRVLTSEGERGPGIPTDTCRGCRAGDLRGDNTLAKSWKGES